MKIEFFGGALDGETRDTEVLYPEYKDPTDEMIAKMKCVVKDDGVYRAKKVKGKWMMTYRGKEEKDKNGKTY